VTRTRVVAAPPERVWELVADPHHLPRWWPRVQRVEDVRGAPAARRTRWTAVLGTDRGRGVRADYRCTGATAPERYAWCQELEGTPFERILRRAEAEVRVEPSDGATRVTVTSEERLRGISRLGSPLMRRAIRRRLDDALEGIEMALVGGGG
jgi:uncharacterized protein YndB with AHSA1/START domain